MAALMTVSLCSLLTWPAGRPSHVHSHHSDNTGKDTPAEGTGQWTSYHARKQWWNCLDGNKMWGSLIPATLAPGCTYRGTVDAKGSPSLLAHARHVRTDIVCTTSHAREHYAEEEFVHYHRLRCFSSQSLAIMFVRTCWLTTPSHVELLGQSGWHSNPKGDIPCKIAHKVCTRNFTTTEADLQLHSMWWNTMDILSCTHAIRTTALSAHTQEHSCCSVKWWYICSDHPGLCGNCCLWLLHKSATCLYSQPQR